MKLTSYKNGRRGGRKKDGFLKWQTTPDQQRAIVEMANFSSQGENVGEDWYSAILTTGDAFSPALKRDNHIIVWGDQARLATGQKLKDSTINF
jgi:hypothetical protein